VAAERRRHRTPDGRAPACGGMHGHVRRGHVVATSGPRGSAPVGASSADRPMPRATLGRIRAAIWTDSPSETTGTYWNDESSCRRCSRLLDEGAGTSFLLTKPQTADVRTAAGAFDLSLAPAVPRGPVGGRHLAFAFGSAFIHRAATRSPPRRCSRSDVNDQSAPSWLGIADSRRARAGRAVSGRRRLMGADDLRPHRPPGASGVGGGHCPG
jgi:hypothetical protein